MYGTHHVVLYLFPHAMRRSLERLIRVKVDLIEPDLLLGHEVARGIKIWS